MSNVKGGNTLNTSAENATEVYGSDPESQTPELDALQAMLASAIGDDHPLQKCSHARGFEVGLGLGCVRVEIVESNDCYEVVMRSMLTIGPWAFVWSGDVISTLPVEGFWSAFHLSGVDDLRRKIDEAFLRARLKLDSDSRSGEVEQVADQLHLSVNLALVGWLEATGWVKTASRRSANGVFGTDFRRKSTRLYLKIARPPLEAIRDFSAQTTCSIGIGEMGDDEGRSGLTHSFSLDFEDMEAGHTFCAMKAAVEIGNAIRRYLTQGGGE